MLAAYAVFLGIPAEAALGPLALYLADTAWTLQRRIRAGERWLQPTGPMSTSSGVTRAGHTSG